MNQNKIRQAESPEVSITLSEVLVELEAIKKYLIDRAAIQKREESAGYLFTPDPANIGDLSDAVHNAAALEEDKILVIDKKTGFAGFSDRNDGAVDERWMAARLTEANFQRQEMFQGIENAKQQAWRRLLSSQEKLSRLGNWQNGFVVPWAEVINSLEDQPEPVRLKEFNLWANHYGVRAEVLLLFADLLIDGKNYPLNKFIEKIQEFDTILLKGQNGDTPYVTYVKAADEQAYYKEALDEIKLIAGKFRSQFTDVNEIFGSLLEQLKKFLEMLVKMRAGQATATEALSLIADFYYTAMEEWLFESGNNSLFFDFVECMIRLLGDDWVGIEHGDFVGLVWVGSGKKRLTQEEFREFFIKTVLSANSKRKGGIDLNPNNVNLEIKGEGIDVPMPAFDPAQLEGMNIEGFYPVIYTIIPVTNLPLLLGTVKENEGQPAGSAQDKTKAPEISSQKSPIVKEPEYALAEVV